VKWTVQEALCADPRWTAELMKPVQLGSDRDDEQAHIMPNMTSDASNPAADATDYGFVGTPFAWGRNLRSGELVDIRLKGKRRAADVQVFSDEAGVVEQYAVMARDNHAFAKFNEIGLDEAGNPSAADLHLAWTAGARAFRLTPH
jgi:hypothetical protein